ncbi:MAG TPA: C40 family peptidase [Gemmatimonadales bacterium]|nr:C40 family peptidase [Gemmatimonadales bacterium]
MAITYSAGYHDRLFGPLDFGIALTHLDDTRSLFDRTATGLELLAGLGRSGRGLYAVGSAGLAWRHDDGDVDAHWSTGLGWAFPILPFLSLGLEARYRAEDGALSGFWDLGPGDRRGVALGFRVAAGTRIPSGARTAGRPGPPVLDPPPPSDVEAATTEAGASPEAARLVQAIVRTALDVMGTPYVWGGDDQTGYDCSGLIQYAYGQHGLLLPRVSRDQARSGMHVDPRIDALRPGDILGFAVDGPGVSHVGLYVGDGRFIHSAASGVRLSSLLAQDPDSQWWRDRWVAARRIVQ